MKKRISNRKNQGQLPFSHPATVETYRNLEKALSQKIKAAEGAPGCDQIQTERHWISAISELERLSTSVYILAFLLEQSFPDMSKCHRLSKREFYLELAKLMLKETASQLVGPEHDSTSMSEEVGEELPAVPITANTNIMTTFWGKRGCRDSCVVCHNHFTEDSVIKTLPCGHFYHETCIDSWLNHQLTCPVCRCKLQPSDESHKFFPTEDASCHMNVLNSPSPNHVAFTGTVESKAAHKNQSGYADWEFMLQWL